MNGLVKWFMGIVAVLFVAGILGGIRGWRDQGVIKTEVTTNTVGIAKGVARMDKHEDGHDVQMEEHRKMFDAILQRLPEK